MVSNNSKTEKFDFKQAVLGKQIYIWGAGHLGVTLYNRLSRSGFNIKGFIDSKKFGIKKCDIFVEDPKTVFGKNDQESIFIIISASLYEDQISMLCRAEGLKEEVDYITISQIKPFHFEVDVAGICNLKCLTCPRGNSPVSYNDGMMSFESYKKVLGKILIISPLLPDIQLYSWGEPLLNTELAQMIQYTNEQGVSVAISSNLSFDTDLSAIVKANPQWFRISLSGYGENYSTIHKGGRWEKVVKNMKQLSVLRGRYAPMMEIEVNFHLYKHNINDYFKIKEICNDLGFSLQDNYAFVDPLEQLIDYKMKRQISTKFSRAMSHLLIPIDTAFEMIKEKKDAFCPCEKNICISANLKVMNCSHVFDPEQNELVQNFLETPFCEIEKRLAQRKICKECRNHSLHSFYSIYLDRTMEDFVLNDKE